MNYNGAGEAEQESKRPPVPKSEQKTAQGRILRIIVGITGASGSIYGIRLLEKLRSRPEVETHLVMTHSGERTLVLETGRKPAQVRSLAHVCYPVDDIGAALASGSFLTDGMAVAPCSIKTLSAIAAGFSSNLLLRAADVTLKERRRLVLAVRETPFHLGHLRAMAALTEMGAIIAPPVPGFYFRPETIQDLVDHSVDRLLDLLGLPAPEARRWPEAGR
jgi:4-hydroxy-3-polyprenylbenzoate decarboxylase